MTAWLVDTFVYTALLIGLVLLLRKPVARHFGPQVAYALWALPLMRLFMPPLVLPAWMAPAQQPTAAAEPLMVMVSDAPAASANAVATASVEIEVLDLLLPLWLGGAALFLIWRTRSYFAMRRELLADARPVGRVGNIRLVEAPAVTAPVAFGVTDKVVALPPAFMAHPDRAARDLAIAHELAHHRGRDLLANIAAQPLLALHWFNPLAWAGWRAMRRDQEAACDARVIAGQGRHSRAAYAQVIANFAAGNQRLALAAPMACPMLGEKSIIHRLRSLTLEEPSSKKRRAGLASVSMAALALPFTASVSYAAPEAPDAPPRVPALAVPSVPLAPAEPPPREAPLAPEPLAAPLPPTAPLPPAPPHSVEHGERLSSHINRQVERQLDLHEEEIEAAFAEMEHELEQLEHLDETIEAALAQAEDARATSLSAIAHASHPAPRVQVEMRCEGDEPVVERDLGDGRTAILICNRAINAQAVEGLREARRAIAREKHMPPEQRQRTIRQLDRQIHQLSARRVSYQVTHRIVAPGFRVAPVVAPVVARATAVEVCTGGDLV